MAECILMKAGGGTGSDECTATKGNVLAGKKAVTSDSDDEAVSGTMPDKGAWTSRIGVNGKALIPAGYHNGAGYVDQAITNRGAVNTALGINGTYTIPEGYHNGAGKVTQNIATMGAQTVTPGNSQKVVSCSGKYMTGNVTVQAVNNLIAANIKKGVVVGGVTGTWEGYVATPTDIYKRGVNNGIAFANIKESKFESTSIHFYHGFNGPSVSGERLYSTKAYNLTAYTGIRIVCRESGNKGSKRFSIYRGAKISAMGDVINDNSIRYEISGESDTVLMIPFTKNHNITDTIGIGIYVYSGSSATNIYEISLY